MRKIPKFLQKPSQSWTEANGMLRAVKVLDLQASELRKQGKVEAATEMRKVSLAIKAAIPAQGIAESVSLEWKVEDGK